MSSTGNAESSRWLLVVANPSDTGLRPILPSTWRGLRDIRSIELRILSGVKVYYSCAEILQEERCAELFQGYVRLFRCCVSLRPKAVRPSPLHSSFIAEL